MRLEPRDGEVVVDRPDRELRLLADGDEAAVTWFRYAPGESGPEPHIHRLHTDAFVVLAGELVFVTDAEEVRAGAGTLVAAPPRLVHTFRNDGDAEARFLNLHVPDGGFAETLRSRRDGREPRVPFDSVDAEPGDGRPAHHAAVAAAGAASVEAETPLGPLRVTLTDDAVVVAVDGSFAFEIPR